MKFSVLTVGDEICIGQIVNTNAAYIAGFMTSLGYAAYLHSTVPDNSEIMKMELRKLLDGSDVVIITGGLGNTHDDITKKVLTEFFDDELIFRNDILEHLEDWFKSRNRKLTEHNKLHSFFPSKARPVRNKVGTAPGILFEINQKLILALPGVPSEVKSILNGDFRDIAVNYFRQYSKDVQLFLTIKTAGIFESSLADLIGSPDNFVAGTTLAYLPSGSGVRLRIGCIESDLASAEAKIELMKQYIISKAGKYIIGYGEQTLQSVLGDLLKSREMTVAVAESCTGGMLGELLTETAGSSAYFKGGIIAYSNEIKCNILNVNEDTINKYGAVSEQTALEMAANVRKLFKTTFGISITGIAGPDGGTAEKPVGTVWFGISDENGTKTILHNFGNDRQLNRERASNTALQIIKERIENYDTCN